MIKTSSNAKSVIRGLVKYQRSIDPKIREFLLKLHQIGANTAASRIAVAEYAGTNDATVLEPHWLSNTKLALEVRGNSIMFIEFGTGSDYVGADWNHPLAGSLPLTTRGSYGEHQGAYPPWMYKGEIGNSPHSWELKTASGAPTGYVMTHGNPANRVVYEAGKEMRQNILNVAREVFGHG